MDTSVTNIFLILIVIMAILLIVAASLLKRYYKTCSDLRREIKSIKDKSFEINSFMRFFAEDILTNIHNDDVYSALARKIAHIVNCDDVCIYRLGASNSFAPTGYTETFPVIFNSSQLVLSKPRFILDALKQDKIDVNEGIFGEINSTKKGIFIPDALSDPRLQTIRNIDAINSFMGIPMIEDSKVTGVICAVNSSSGKMFNLAQFELFDSISRIAAVIFQIIHSYMNATTREHLNREIEITRLLQKTLLPKEPPECRPFVIYAYTRSSKEVSGDFYDFVPIDENRMLVVQGDSSGKGLPACMMMAMTRSFIRANSVRFTTLSDLMVEINTNLYRDTDEGRFATLICCLLDKKEKTLELARAGHTELLVFSTKQKIRKIRPHGSALGLMPTEISGHYDTMTFSFKKYYSVLLFSDGIIEALNKKGEEYGSDRLSDVFYDSCAKKNSPEKTSDRIMKNLDDFCSSDDIADDQTLVVISHEESFIQNF